MIPVEKSALPALRPSNRYLLHWNRGQAGPGSRVLDFGCGNGAGGLHAQAEGSTPMGRRLSTTAPGLKTSSWSGPSTRTAPSSARSPAGC